MKTVKTDLLEIAYFDDGPPDAAAVLLLHGWPDDALGMMPVAGQLNVAGYRTIVPYLRGFGPTRFRHHGTFRDGRGVALAQDALDLLDALGIERCFVIGHDWGARAGYNMAAIDPVRLRGLVTLGLPYTPNGAFEVPKFEQARLWWYQWLMTTDPGAEKVRRDPIGFARLQWDTWSPGGWFLEADFASTAESFRNPDWLEITLHGYRSRWREEPVDPRYSEQQDLIQEMDRLPFLTSAIIGCDDSADNPYYLTDPAVIRANNCKLELLPGFGHFLAREAPEFVTEIVRAYFAKRELQEV